MSELKRKVLKLINGDAVAPAAVVPPAVEAKDVPSIGSVLRSTREQAGLELRDVATVLKIRHVFMQAIEAGRYQELPGAAYAVGFVRAYADYLGLDPEAIVTRFKDEVAGNHVRQSLYFPTPVPEGKVPGGTILLVSLVLVVLVYGSWYALSASDRSVVDVVPALPHRLVTLLDAFSRTNGGSPAAAPAPTATAATTNATPTPPGAPSAAADSPPPSSSTTPAVADAGAKPAPPPAPSTPAPSPPSAPAAADGDAGDETPLVSGPADELEGGRPGPLVPMAPRTKPMPPSAAGTPPATPAVAGPAAGAPAVVAPPAGAVPPVPPPAADAGVPTGKIYGSQHRESRIQIKAIQETWIQVQGAHGDAIFTRVLRPGEVYRVPDRAGLRLRASNAGGLVVSVDGGAVQPLGSVGQVVRDLPVDAATLRRGAPGAAN
jgi:cytoskeletal protein RodZ